MSFAQYWGGQLEYEHQSGKTYRIDLFLYLPATQPAPDTIGIRKGDGSGQGGITPSDSSLLCDSLKRVLYPFEHTYPGSGNYTLHISDSSYARPFINTPGIDSAYGLRSELVINPFTNGANSTVEFHDKPQKKVHPNDSLVYNPAFTNPDGDSLAFELVRRDSAPAYQIPSGITLNSESGELRWKPPDTNGRYSFTMEVSEYGSEGLKGWTQRQFTVHVHDSISTQTNFKQISGFQTNAQGYSEVHVTPGQTLDLVLQYKDPMADSVSLDAIGEPFSQTPSPFYFTSDSGTTVNGSFSWTPDSSHVRDHPYILSFVGHSHPNCTDRYKPVMIHVDEASSLAEPKNGGKGRLELYPNPANSRLILRVPEKLQEGSAHILNSKGRTVKRINMEGEGTRVDVKDLPSGLYFLRVHGEDTSWDRRFLKE